MARNLENQFDKLKRIEEMLQKKKNNHEVALSQH
jgi:hypothetical protein